jgi:hypothetical protein
MSAAANSPRSGNEHIRELISILRENKIDVHELLGVIGHIAAVERELGKAAAELSAMRKELAEMREDAGHPIRTELRSAARGLAGKISAARSGIKALKDKIIAGCKRAVEAFKTGGITALNNLAGFFDIRRGLENTRDAINDAIKYNEEKIAKIESMSEEYHAAGRGLRNIGRIMSGREPIKAVQPNGTLAKIIELPFSSEVRRLSRSLNRTGKALAGLDRLEKAAKLRRELPRPSTLEEMKRLKVVVKWRKKDAPAKDAVKKADVAI